MKYSPVRRSELLMPAGSLERLKVAALYGADAIYMGTPDMSMRTVSAFAFREQLDTCANSKFKPRHVFRRKKCCRRE